MPNSLRRPLSAHGRRLMILDDSEPEDDLV
jgi:hypothetical protein